MVSLPPALQHLQTQVDSAIKNRTDINGNIQTFVSTGNSKNITSLRDLNQIGINLTTLAQEQKNRTGLSNIKVTNSLISELSNLANSGSKANKTFLSNLGSGLTSAIHDIVTPVITFQTPQTIISRRTSRNSVFAPNAVQTQGGILTHGFTQNPTSAPQTPSNIPNDIIVDDGSLGDLFDSFGIDTTEIVNADGSFNFSDFAKKNPLVIAGGLGLLFILMTRGGKRRR